MKTIEPGSSGDTTYLIKNSIFEKNGQSSLNGWTFHAVEDGDTAIYTNPGRYFDTDVPPGGGTYSFRLHTADSINQYNQLKQSFTNLKSGVYSLSVWMKYKYVFTAGTYPPSWIAIIKSNGGVPQMVRQDAADSATWQEQTLLDTLNLLPTDTVTALLSGGAKNGGPSAHGNPLSVDDINFKKLP